MKNSTRRYCLSAAVAVLVMVVPLAAQQQNIRTINRYVVKPDRAGDFRAAVKEYNEVLRKAGADRPGTVWTSLSGPNEFVRVMYFSKFAELDQQQDPKLKDVRADLQRIGSRIMACVDKTERIIDEMNPDLTLPRTADMPNMVSLLRTVVRPDKVAEYEALLKAEIMPAVKKSGVKSFGVGKTRFGSLVSEYRSYLGLDNWAAVDGMNPLVEAMGGREAYAQYLAKVRPLIVEAQYDMYRFEPELSYIPAAAVKTTSNTKATGE